MPSAFLQKECPAYMLSIRDEYEAKVVTEGGVDRLAPFLYKIADTENEFEQISILNYNTFVREIPQHVPNADGKLIDRFHDQNTYVIGLDGDRVIAMVAVRTERPFSLDEKIVNLDVHVPEEMIAQRNRWCEVRLLAIEPAYRKSRVFVQLLDALIVHAIEKGLMYALISATTREQRLYAHMGAEPFHEPVGTAEAMYVPMIIRLTTFRKATQHVLPTFA